MDNPKITKEDLARKLSELQSSLGNAKNEVKKLQEKKEASRKATPETPKATSFFDKLETQPNTEKDESSLDIIPETNREEDTTPKPEEEAGLTNEKEDSPINQETKEAKEKKWDNFFKLQEIKLKIREGFLSPAKKAIYDIYKETIDSYKEAYRDVKKGISAYSEFMNGGKVIYQTKMGTDAEGQPIYYKYTYRKLALSSAIAGTAVAFLPVTGLASATVFGTKIARGMIGGLAGAFANKGVSKIAHENIEFYAERKRALEKESITANAEEIKSIERTIRINKLAFKGAAIMLGITAGYTASLGFSSAASLLDKNIPDLPKFNLGNTEPNNETQFTNTGRTLGGGDHVWNKEELQTEMNPKVDTLEVPVTTEETPISIHQEKETVASVPAQKVDEVETNTPETTNTTPAVEDNEKEIEQTDPIVEEKNVPENSNSSIPKEAMIDSKNNVGITYAFKSQLESNPELAEKLGYNQAENKALFLKELGKKLGYIGEHDEVRIKADTNVAYVLKVDETGNPSVEEYQNGKIVETHKSGDVFENQKANTYEYKNETIKNEYGIKGGQVDPGNEISKEYTQQDPTNISTESSEYAIKGPQVNPETNETFNDKHAIEGDQVNPDLTSAKTGTVNENIVKSPEGFSIEKTVWADPKHIDVKYYLNFEKAINDTSVKNTLNKDILDALIKNGTVIDNKTTDIFGNIRHEYHFQGEEVVQRTQEHAEYMNKVSGRNIINTDPRVGETMQQYVDRLEHNMKTFAENSKTSNAPEEYQKGRSDGFHDAVQERKLYGHRNELARFGSRLLTNVLLGPENGTYWGAQGPARVYNPRPNY